MNERNGPLYWSIPCGTMFATRVRVSVFFPLLVLVLCFRLGMSLGLLFGVIVFASTLCHEFGHVFGARATGGSGDEILMWPFGGLAFVRPTDRLGSRLWTSAAGPLVNLTLALATFWPTYRAGQLGPALNPFVLPAIDVENGPLLTNVLVLFFVANWLGVLINLIPVYPLDGGQMLNDVLTDRMGRAGTEAYLRISQIVALLALLAGLMFDNTTVMFIAAIVLVLNMQETVRHQTAEPYEDSFMGYDFSQGYTSLERDDEEDERPAPRPPRKGWLQRWKERRRTRREARQRERDAADEQRLDELLEKVQLVGMDGLTSEEQRFLKRTSERMRERGRPDG